MCKSWGRGEKTFLLVRREMVDEKGAVEMVGLVLEDPREHAEGADGDGFAEHVATSGRDHVRTFQRPPQIGCGQACLVGHDLSFGRLQARIDQMPGPALQFVDDDPQRDAELGAASPARPIPARMVACRDLTSPRNSRSKVVTGSATVRSTGSLNSRIG